MIEKSERKLALIFIGVFLALYFLPVGTSRFDTALLESFHLAKWYAREHVLLCLIPAFLIAGAIGVFIHSQAVIQYLGSRACKLMAYAVGSVSGAILAVCSCTILPLFSSIYKRGAGLGPAIAFLYSGPAINILAIVMTARILGIDLGIARTVGAIAFSVVIGLLMELFFKNENADLEVSKFCDETSKRPWYQTFLYFAAMILILVFANFGGGTEQSGIWFWVYQHKWWLTSASALLLGIVLVRWFQVALYKVGIVAGIVAVFSLFFSQMPVIPFTAGVIAFVMALQRDPQEEHRQWMSETWRFAKQIFPLLIFGVLAAGFLFGRVGSEGIVPSDWVKSLVGGNSLQANFVAAFAGAFMYFATLTEVPILQGLMGNGMGKGPALALLLAGPALSLPSMLVIRQVLGTKKTLVFVSLVIVLATFAGYIFGLFFG